MELDEPAVALGLQHQRRAAIGLSRAERGEHLERQPAIGVNVELYRLEANPDNHRSVGSRRYPTGRSRGKESCEGRRTPSEPRVFSPTGW